ncbi:MAG: glycosyltransferase family 39 protein [Sandaracinaceae bacterium]|nr:glycosyltransferase family 39 protein [Sandaracinaceae bacterium]
MELSRKKSLTASVFAFAFPALILLIGISAFGIWDPWELATADEARQFSLGRDVELTRAPLRARLIGIAFKVFGVHEWSGRTPMVLCGLLALGAGYLLAKRFSDTRTAAYAAIVAGTTPIFLFNSRQMLGHSIGFAAQALIALTAASAVFFPTASDDEAKRRNTSILWLVGLIAAVTMGVFAEGALVGALPPLAAIVVAAALEGTLLSPKRDPRRAYAAYFVSAITLLLIVLVSMNMGRDDADFSYIMGAAPHAGNAPTYDSVLDKVFHSFAPWSAILPIAIGRLFISRKEEEPEVSASDESTVAVARTSFTNEQVLRTVVLVWATFGYGAQTLFESRYGVTGYLPVIALGIAVASLLSDIEDSKTSWWAVGIIGALFAGLILRDFDLYPGGPIEGLGLADVTVPEIFNPKAVWAGLLGLFAVSIALATAVEPGHRPLDLKAPYRWFRTQWQKPLPFKIWLGFFASVLLAALVVGIVFRIINLNPNAQNDVPLIVRKWLARLFVIPLAVPLLITGTQLTFFVYRKLGEFRIWPLLVIGAAVGAYSAQGYLPALSEHFSPREIYDTYNAHARPSEPFAQFGVGGRAASFYARGEVRDIPNQAALITYLSAPTQQWAAFAADQLPAVDRAYRERTGRHIFIADARSARVLLASSLPVAGVQNQNFVAQFVLPAVPNVQHRVGVRFDDKIEFIGYDLDLPHNGYVGGGEAFTITWYFRCLRPVPGGYKMFVHIDGAGNRLNGDHEPVEDRYPVRLWNAGDIIKDVQRLTVPGNYRPGNYGIFMGFYAGESRLTTVSGPHDADNRANAGVLRIQ